MKAARLSQALAAAGLSVCLCLAIGFNASALAAEPLVYQSSFGPDGTAATNFDKAGSVAIDQQSGAVYVIDRAAGTLSKFDGDGQPLAFSGAAPYISGNQISGLSFFSRANESQVAVDSVSHRIYVTSANSVRAFEADGEPAEFTAGPGAGTSEISGAGELIGVAVDAGGYIYASDYTGFIRIYAPDGEFVTQIETSTPANLAVATDGSLYVSKYGGAVVEFSPSEFPITSTTTYTPAAEPLDEGTSQTVAVDPVTGNVYVSELVPGSFEFTHVLVYDPSGTLVDTFGGPGEEGELAGTSPGIAVEGSSGRVYVSTDDETFEAIRSQVEIFAPKVIAVGPPTIVGTSASDVTADTATLRASINPNTKATTFRFEYGTQDCSIAADACTIVPGGSVGSGHDPVPVSLSVAGLQPNSLYHYRVVAENELGVTEGSDHIFVTEAGGLGFQLSDNRVWEMVSPPDKSGGVLRTYGFGAIQAEEGGDGLVYLSIGSIMTPEGNRAIEPSTIIARRGGDGWHSRDITPPHTKATTLAVGTEYDVFSPELSKALLEPRDATPLSPASSERTPYLWGDSEPSLYTPLVTSKEGFANVPPGTVFGGDELRGQVSEVSVAGSNPGLTHVVLSSEVPLVAGAAPNGQSLYEWAEGHLDPVSVLPEGDGGAVVQGFLGSAQGSVRRAVSDDGSRVFWSPGNIGTASINFTALYLRDTAEEVSSRLDQVQSDASGTGDNRPAFQGASADGTVVFFTDSQQLTGDASLEGRDLYRCEIPSGAAVAGCASLTDISAPLTGSAESAEVQGLVSAVSADGSRVYFVAQGKLSAAANGAGETATGGEPNLYLWEEGGGVRFIATLSTDDDRDWGLVHGDTPGYARNLTAAASPSGRYFAFMSELSLTGYENRSQGSGSRSEEVFRYDAVADALTCISCLPSGASPDGNQDSPDAVDPQSLWEGRSVSALLPEATVSGGTQLARYPLYLPRSVLDNGRVFFNSADGLVPADSNREWDVYQFEPTGVGNCSSSPEGTAVARIAGACVSLLSSGTAEQPSAFLDASASGNDVFFISAGRLSVLDKDTANDVYDARVNGTPAVLTADPGCVGETCQPSTGAPIDPTPASEAFRGPEGAIKCPKGKRKVLRHGRVRCVRKHRKHKRHHHKRTSKDGRAHR